MSNRVAVLTNCGGLKKALIQRKLLAQTLHNRLTGFNIQLPATVVTGILRQDPGLAKQGGPEATGREGDAKPKRNRPALGRRLAHRILTGKKAGRRVGNPFFKM